MEITIGERRIEVPQEEADRLVKEFGTPGWTPSDEEEYWLVDSDGEISKSYWDGGGTDKRRFALGNVFETRETALSHADWLKAVAEIKGSTDFVPDWNSYGQSKYFVFYDHQNGTLCVEYFDCYQNQSIVHYKSHEEAEQAIQAHKDAYLTYFGIKTIKGGMSND